ncbi:MAG: Gfo/Idh/MocA family oxidoreductase [Chloroflexi bacterium]|nr:Gfo/Idh/MocA family oxidoreductase [Chloroflexota bacterium]
MRIGLIGCGEIARRGHLPALKALSDFRVEAVADQDIERARRVAREFGIARTYAHAQELVQDPGVEAIVATVPPVAYKEIVSLAAAGGKPLLLEKPLANSLADAQFIVDTVKRSGIKAGIVQNYRYYAALRDARNRLVSGRLGKPVSVHILLHQHSPLSWSLSPWRFEGTRGVLDDIGVHAFDTLIWLVGSEPRRVTAVGANGLPCCSFLNQVCTLVEFDGGAIGEVDLSWLTGPMVFRVSMLGTGGRLFSDVLYNQVSEHHGHPMPTGDVALLAKKFVFMLRGTMNGSLFTGALMFYRDLYRDFALYVKGANSDFPGVETGLRTVRVMDAVAQSLAGGAAVRL